MAESGSEEWLLARARRGDQQAFERLYRLHVSQVYGLCLRMTRDTAHAEDCTQQAFSRAWLALPAFELRSVFGTWLYRIAVNVVLMSRRAEPEQEVAASVDDSEDTDVTFDTPVEVAEIEAAIESLPRGARDVLVLAGIYGYSHGEVAAMLGVTIGTCKAQLHRARALLRERLNLEELT